MLLLSGYDYTLDESGVEKDEKTNKQEYVNNNAKVGVRALAMMAGYRRKYAIKLDVDCGCFTCHWSLGEGVDATPPNEAVQASLSALIMPYMAKMLSNPDPIPVCLPPSPMHQNPAHVVWLQLLKLFNANTENPYLIWDNSTRAELTDFVESNQESIVKTVGDLSIIKLTS